MAVEYFPSISFQLNIFFKFFFYCKHSKKIISLGEILKWSLLCFNCNRWSVFGWKQRTSYFYENFQKVLEFTWTIFPSLSLFLINILPLEVFMCSFEMMLHWAQAPFVEQRQKWGHTQRKWNTCRWSQLLWKASLFCLEEKRVHRWKKGAT